MRPRTGTPVTLAASMVAVLLLTLMPLPGGVVEMRPYWAALVLIYWNLEAGRLRHLGQAFAGGLVLDVLTGTLLGQQALGLVIISYLVERSVCASAFSRRCSKPVWLCCCCSTTALCSCGWWGWWATAGPAGSGGRRPCWACCCGRGCFWPWTPCASASGAAEHEIQVEEKARAGRHAVVAGPGQSPPALAGSGHGRGHCAARRAPGHAAAG